MNFATAINETTKGYLMWRVCPPDCDNEKEYITTFTYDIHEEGMGEPFLQRVELDGTLDPSIVIDKRDIESDEWMTGSRAEWRDWLDQRYRRQAHEEADEFYKRNHIYPYNNVAKGE